LIDKLKRMHFGRKFEQLDRQIENLEIRLAGGTEMPMLGEDVSEQLAPYRGSVQGDPHDPAQDALPELRPHRTATDARPPD
ncbi:MAG: IS66 family transposase, partial [Burkholderia sp.]